MKQDRQEQSQSGHVWNDAVWHNLTKTNQRQNHALLFSGNAGLGKRDIALRYARHILSDTEQSISLFDAGNHPDLHVIMAENHLNLEEGDLASLAAVRYIEEHKGKPKKNINIEQIRRLAEKVSTSAHLSQYKVLMVFGAEQMNNNASNAFLKSLEEPSANTVIILVTDEIDRISKTIRSRCSLLHFKAPTTDVALQWLQQHMPAVDSESYLALAGGSPLRALDMHKQDYLGQVKQVFNDANALWGRRKYPVETAREWQKLGAQETLNIIQKLLIDLVRLSSSPEPASLFFPVQKQWLQKVSSMLSQASVIDVIDKVTDAKRMLRTTVDELLVMETITVNLAEMTN